MIVDDSADHRFLAHRRLVDAGWEVGVATAADEALTMLEGVDLVLLDHGLPGMSGIEALREIRRRNGPSVVMVTGMGSEGLAVEAIRAGAVDYITKDGSYLQDLPQDVERAWRHHDVQRRTRELQRLAIAVTTTSDRDRQETLTSIVDAACDVLRADACAIVIIDEDGLRAEATSGATLFSRLDLGSVAQAAFGRAPHDGAAGVIVADVPLEGGSSELITDRLLVPIHSAEGDALGVLVVLTSDAVDYNRDELDLARTFGAFAGVALASLRRLELEQRLVAELQHVLDVRREFLAHVSHELRTPLTCIEGFAHTLLTHGDELGAETARVFLTKIGDHGRALHQLVESLLDFAAVEAGRTPAEPAVLELRAEIDSVIDGLDPLLGGRTVHVDVNGATVIADPALFRRAMTNLITNAAKYSEPGGPIRIYARGVAGPGEVDSTQMVRIEVVDTGPGISEEDLTHIFDPFWRGSPLKGGNRGTGLGLPLVREYARLLGGDSGASSSPGGSRFWVTIPTIPGGG